MNLGRVFDLVNFVPVEGDSAPGAGDGGGFPGGITQSRANNHRRRRERHDHRARAAQASCLTGSGNGVIGGWTSASLRQARLLNPAADVLASGCGWRSVGADLAARHAARQRARHRPARQGSLQRQRAALRRPVRHLRDEPDAAGAARRAVPRRRSTRRWAPTFANLAPSNLPRNDLVTAFLTGFPGVNQMSKVTRVRNDAAQHRHSGGPGRQPEQLRRCRWRSRGLPERPPSGRRHGGYRAARGHGSSVLSADHRRQQRRPRVCARRRTRPWATCRSPTARRYRPPTSIPTFPYLTTPLPGSGGY